MQPDVSVALYGNSNKNQAVLLLELCYHGTMVLLATNAVQ